MASPVSKTFTTSSELEVATTLRHLALNEDVKAYVLQDQALYPILMRAAMRFIGGETLKQCVQSSKQLNEQGFATTVDFMGESIRKRNIAQQATEEFLQVIQAITTEQLNSSVSLDLSHIGMVIDTNLAYENASVLARAAHNAGIEVMISMEGTDRTDTILAVYQRLGEHFDNVGITLQAYLYRTFNDLQVALKYPGKIRLVKGAYEAPPNLVRPRGTELDQAYFELTETLLKSGHSCSIATHDSRLLDQTHKFICEQGIERTVLEFEMLKGVTPEKLQAIQKLGYHTRVYLPYGQEWYLYFCNRLAEHPPNLYQAIIDSASVSYPTRYSPNC